ncbi:hypothetical protein MY4038_009770 [Beauveria bassiana]
MTNLRALAQQQIDWDIERSGLQEGVEAERARLEQNSLRHKIQDNEQKIKALIEAKKYAEGTATKLRGEKETMQMTLKEPQLAYVRAALAKVLPGTQKQGQNRGAELVITDVMTAIDQWSSDEQALRSGLKHLCDKALYCWALAQQVEDRIWPDFRFELSEDWQPLPIPCRSTTPTSNTPNSKKLPNTDKTQHSAPNHESRQILSSEVVEIVWQTFFAAEPQSPGSADATDLDRLHCGKTDQAGRFSATEENPSSESPVISSGWHDEVGRKVQEWRYFDSMMLSDGDFMPVEGNKDGAEGHGANTGR